MTGDVSEWCRVWCAVSADETEPRDDADDDDDDDDDIKRQPSDVDYSSLPHHLHLDSQLTFSITILQASGIPADCTDVFCQFK